LAYRTALVRALLFPSHRAASSQALNTYRFFVKTASGGLGFIDAEANHQAVQNQAVCDLLAFLV